MLYSALINVMVKAARRAGRSLKRDLGEIEHLQVSLKGPANFVSLADKRAEEMLYTDLAKARPGYGFIGEEGGNREGADKSHTWIVDPLDGTTNFLHGIPQFAISIGLAREGTVIAGVIYNPANEELYIAERGKGAFLNDQRCASPAAASSTNASSPAACRISAAATTRWRGRKWPLFRTRSPASAASAPPRSTSPSSPPAASTAIGSAICSPGISQPARSWCAKPAASFQASRASDDPLQTGHVVCGNEFVHGELLKILKPLGQ